MTNKTRTYFDDDANTWISESYEKGFTIAHTRLQAVLDLVRMYSPDSLLDVGSGDGRFLRMVKGVTKRAGIDYSKKMIEIAQQNSPKITFTQLNLNNQNDIAKLSKLGKYDVITMMGVVHYLDSPSASLSGLTACCHKNTHLIISFRNRLMNSNPSSKYYESSLTQRDISRLNDEIILWSNKKTESDDLLKTLGMDSEGHRLISLIKDSGDYEGVTDNYWNPDNFNHWRQFTPLDAIVLMGKSDFKVQRVVPLSNTSFDIDKASESASESSGNILSACSSFLLVVKPGV